MTDASRPDPDALLARMRDAAGRQRRGRLKIFLGASPGVGKTFAMLEAARAMALAGKDVIAGVVETHGRVDTAALLQGLQRLPMIQHAYRGKVLEEFDLDGALALRPALILVDELAHTNVTGSRHAKRWQDVQELLAAGLDVYTTVNIQHIESLNDVVAQITGVTVRETIPDAVLDEADELELVDVSPDVLLERLRAGKVYLPAQAERALEHFFTRGNLMALRELALRRTAQQVDAEMLDWREEAGIRRAVPAGERVLVAIPASPDAPRLVRAGWRLATALRAECLVLHVETVEVRRASAPDRSAVVEALRLAEELGARAQTVTGIDVGAELIAWAHEENVTRLVVGRAHGASWTRRFRRSPVDRLLAAQEGIDVHVLALREGPVTRAEEARLSLWRGSVGEYGVALMWVTVAAGFGFVVRDVLSTTDIAMGFLLSVAFAGGRSRPGPGIAAAIASIALFDFAFVPPYYTFAVSDGRYFVTFVVMLLVAIAVSRLTSRSREQAIAARARERQTGALLELAKELALATAPAFVAEAVSRRIRDSIGAEVAVLVTGAGDTLELAAPSAITLDDKELTVARWARDRRESAGFGTATLPTATAFWAPLAVAEGAVGALGVRPKTGELLRAPERRQFLDAVAGQAALALERLRLMQRTQHDQVEIEGERLRTALLSSLSHDLRTPLAAVEGAATTLRRDLDALDPATREDLLTTILEEARRMGRLISNLLDMVRVESGSLQVQREWQSVEEVIGVALLRVDNALAGLRVAVEVPADLPLLRVDGLLIEQVLVNLLENAVRYGSAGKEITVWAHRTGDAVEIGVADRGPGVAAAELDRIFEKFHRGAGASAGGIGLGLAICRAIIAAHGGTIYAELRDGGGLQVIIRLPLPGDQPAPVPEAVA
ncbi:MAG: sensor histidine kinase KdpD [Gemmatimonadota bacterium]